MFRSGLERVYSLEVVRFDQDAQILQGKIKP